MKIIVVGAGSIGKRHLRNLKNSGVTDLAVCDPDPANRNIIAQELGLTLIHEKLEDANLASGDVVYICSPNHLHASQALYAAKNKCHIFVEKPLAHTYELTEELCQLTETSGLTTMVGCNMRFYPAIQTLKKLLSEQLIGRVLSYRVTVGIYLPNWRPHLDYRKNYGAHKSQGGGAILDMIHEIDYSRWLFGDPSSVSSIYKKLSDLEIDTEDVAEITLDHHTPNRIGNIHLDYLSHRYTRMVHAIGEHGDLFWEWHRMGVEHFDGKTKKQIFYPIPENYNLNQMYLEETQYFFDCVHQKKETFFPFREARRVLEISLAAKQSSEEACSIQLTPYPHTVSKGR